MMRLVLTMIGTALLMAQAPAPGRSDAVRQACEPDLRRHCSEAVGIPLRIRACLTADPARLSPACRTALRSAGVLPQ
jgi:hypothetical protein